MVLGSGDGDYRIVHRMNSAGNSVISDPRTGLNQILEMKDFLMDPAAPSSSSPELQTQVDSPEQGQTPWCFPPLGVAVPAFNEVSQKFAETASLFSRRFTGFGEEAVVSEGRLEKGDMAPSSVAEEASLLINGTDSTTENDSSTEERQLTVVIPSSRGAIESVAVPNFGGAVSLFNATGAAMMGMGQTLMTGPPAVWQGCCSMGKGILSTRTVNKLLTHRAELMPSKSQQGRVTCGGNACFRSSRQGLVSRVQTTLRGSADDIGWLQKDPSLPPVIDKTERFVQLLGRISHGVHVLPDSIVYLLIPGLFSNHGPLYFVETKKYFSKLGLPCYIARIHSEAGVERNARELKEYIEELYWGIGKRVLLLGHSKGGVDAAAACAKYWPDLKDKVVGLVFAQSPYGGSPIASDILREGQIADFETRRILDLIITRVIKGDMQSLEDLTYDKRREFVAQYPLPAELVTVSFHTEASRAASVFSTMSHIAQADVPWLPGTSTPGGPSEEAVTGAKLPVVIPLAAAMALCALHLDLRYGEKSDGLVARKDAEIPGSVVVRPEKKLDHAWMVYAPSRKEPNDPDSAQMCEALLTLLLEEEAARKSVSSSGDKPLLDETAEASSSAPETPSTEIPEGEDYLEKL